MRQCLTVPLLAGITLGTATAAHAADQRPCPTAREALERARVAADAVEEASGNVVLRLMPAALSAEQAAGEAELAAWPGTIVAAFGMIATEARALAADPGARTPEAARSLREHAQSGESEIAPICGP